VSLVIILFIAGIVAILFEIFIPGGVLGAVGIFLLLASVVSAFRSLGSTGGIVTLFLALALAPTIWFIGLGIFPKSWLGKTLTLKTEMRKETGWVASTEIEKRLLNREGKTLTTLRPAGVAIIEGERVDVISEGMIIERDTPIRVVRVEGNQVIVRKIS